MIKASALLVVLAIGLLVTGVLGSSLLMVYVSIGVCAVAALLLAVGVFSHWSEIFGRREARPASTQGVWSEPQVHVTGPVLASLQAVAAAAARGSGRPVAGEADVRPGGGRSGGERPHDHPAEAVQSQAAVGGRIDELPAAGRSDDLWERVEEELGSAAKRDTGALSWPGTAFPPVPPDVPVPSELAAPATEAGAQSEPRVGASAWIWGSGAGWQPTESPEAAWPPPAAAFAEPQPSAEQASPEPGKTEPAGNETARTEATGSASAGARRTAWDSPRKPVPETAAGPGPDAGPAPQSPDSEAAGTTMKNAPEEPAGKEVASEDAAAEKPAPEDAAAAEPAADKPAVEDRAVTEPAGQEPAGQEPAAEEAAAEEPAAKEPAVQGERPQWIIPAPAVQDPSVRSAAPADSPAEDAEVDGAHDQDPQAQDSSAQDSEANASEAEDAGAGKPTAGGPDAPESPAQQPAADGPAAKPPPGRVEVTVVPGVARYHRSECILIRFLGADDLEIMTRQEAEEAKFAACRACQPDQLEG